MIPPDELAAKLRTSEQSMRIKARFAGQNRKVGSLYITFSPRGAHRKCASRVGDVRERAADADPRHAQAVLRRSLSQIAARCRGGLRRTVPNGVGAGRTGPAE